MSYSIPLERFPVVTSKNMSDTQKAVCTWAQLPVLAVPDAALAAIGMYCARKRSTAVNFQFIL